MPLYDFECPECGKQQERFDYVGKRKARIKCECGHFAKPVITVRSKPVVMEGWIDEIQAYVTGPRHHRQILKEKQMSER